MKPEFWLIYAVGLSSFLMAVIAINAALRQAQGGERGRTAESGSSAEAKMDTEFRKPDWGKAQLALRKEIANWIKGAIARQSAIPFQGGHDEANYTSSWAEYYRLTGDPKPIEFMHSLRDQIVAWPKFYHGFYPEPSMDIEHSFENWTGFMTALVRLDPQDEKALAAIEDVVHHLGNWVPGIPDWYDWKAHRFTSEWLGTRKVRNFPPYDATTYWDARAVELALIYFELKGDRKYLDWAADCGGEWARAMLASKGAGPGWFFPITDREEIKRRYGVYPEDFEPRVKGWLGEIGRLFLHLFGLTKKPEFQQAALKIIEQTQPPAIPKLAYQEATGDLRFKAEIEAAKAASDKEFADQAAALLDEPLPTILLLEGDATYPVRKYAYRTPNGDLKDSQTSTSGLWRAFRLTSEVRFASRTFELAAVHLRLACRTLRDGREHGCNGRFIHGAGGEAVGRLCAAADARAVEYFQPSGARGLSSALAALVWSNKEQPNERRIYLYNDDEKDRVLKIRLGHDQPPIQTAVAEDGRSLMKEGAVEVVARAKQVTVVVVRN
jgi:hypothetical protein